MKPRHLEGLWEALPLAARLARKVKALPAESTSQDDAAQMRHCAGRMGGRKTRTTVRKLPLKFQMRVLSGRLPVTAGGHHQSVMRLNLEPMRP
eukprot:COSAG01_NODE_4302_length_5160_cov_16.365936_2_plen_93_part_00